MAGRLTRLVCPTLLCLAAPLFVVAQDPQPVSYYRQVRPVFQGRCFGCHQPAKPSGQYVMTDFAPMARGGESGQLAIVAGDPDESYLIELIQTEGGRADMPKDDHPLDEDQIALVRRWIAEGALDDTPPNARLQFDIANPPRYSALPVVTSLDISPDGTLIAVSGYHEVLLHTADGRGAIGRLIGMSERVQSLAFSPDGRWLAAAAGSPERFGEIQIWDVERKSLKLSRQIDFDTLYGASWSGDGSLLAFGCPDTTVRAIRADTGEQVLFNGAHDDWVLDTVFSTDGSHLISVSRDRSMKLIQVDQQRFIDNITSITPGALKGGLHAVDRHPTSDQLLVGGSDGVPKMYRMLREQARKIGDDYNLIRAFSPMKGRIFDVRFSADGSRVAAVSSYDGTGELAVFETDSGNQVSRSEISTGGLYAVAFFPDGQRLVTAGFDGRLRIFDVPSGTVIEQRDAIPPEFLEQTTAR